MPISTFYYIFLLDSTGLKTYLEISITNTEKLKNKGFGGEIEFLIFSELCKYDACWGSIICQFISKSKARKLHQQWKASLPKIQVGVWCGRSNSLVNFNEGKRTNRLESLNLGTNSTFSLTSHIIQSKKYAFLIPP